MTGFFISLYALIILVCVANIVRLHFYGKFLIAEVERIFSVRMSGDRSATYPDIGPSYKNFKWYDIFNYKFDGIVVYEKERK